MKIPQQNRGLTNAKIAFGHNVMKEIAVLLVVRSDDPRLDPENIRTVKGMAAFRQAVLDALPDKVSRVCAAMEPVKAQMMMQAMDRADTALGLPPIRPPMDYIPPTRD